MMLCLKKLLFKQLLIAKLLTACLVLLAGFSALAQQQAAEIVNLKASRLDKDVVVSASLRFELPSSIEAMYKGVSLTFVAEADITKERWYWTDKTIATASRQIRISYQALTRRWRVLPWSDASAQGGLGVQLPQTYETLLEALAVAQRIHNWRVAEAADVGEGGHMLTMRYRLDMSQLPKPLQVGLLGQGDWTIAATSRHRLGNVSVPVSN
jgi:sensor domain CHASE-containing protein